jgi:hypothetical protein
MDEFPEAVAGHLAVAGDQYAARHSEFQGIPALASRGEAMAE